MDVREAKGALYPHLLLMPTYVTSNESRIRSCQVISLSKVSICQLYKQISGVESGCPDTSVRVVSAFDASRSDLQPRVTVNNVTADVNVEISLRFKTKTLNGQLAVLQSDSDAQVIKAYYMYC